MMMGQPGVQVQQLAQAAQQAMQTGRLDEAAQLWSRVLASAPEHPQALFHLGQHKLYRRDAAGALAVLQRAANADPTNPIVPLNISFACRAIGDNAGELAALDRAIAIDPFCFPALLAKGAALHRTGATRQAARIYRDALAILPPDEHLPSEFAATVAEARALVSENARQLEALLATSLDELRRKHAAVSLERFDEASAGLIGIGKIYTQQPTLLHYPRLPAIPFYDRADFPWLAEIEAKTGIIREELRGFLASHSADFRPYLANPMGTQVEYAPRWKALFLWLDGKRVDENCARCPQTTKAVESAPLADVPGAAPTVFFSALEPKTRIPAHTGVTNTRLIVHLPLIVPEGCWFRVGNQAREWRNQEALIFDDTIEHEAWNGSDELRVLLIFDIWNPYLNTAERELVRGLMATFQNYYAA